LSLSSWNHKRPKVNKNVIIQSIEDGGIKAPDFSSIVKANRVSWVKRLLTSQGKWKAIISDLIHPISLEHFLQTNLSEDDILCIPIPFYRQVLKSWNEIKHQPNNACDYMQEILWDNKYIQTHSLMRNKKRKKHTIFCPRLYKAGVIRLGNLIGNNGKLWDFKAFVNIFNVKCTILLYYKITKAIPVNWLTDIELYFQQNRTNVVPDLHCLKITSTEFALDIRRASTKAICNCFIKQNYQTPSAIEKWGGVIETPTDWHHIFRLPCICTRETQLQALHYRIIHRFLPCNKWLCDISIVNSNVCKECNSVDTIEHYLYACNSVKMFWVKLEQWWNDTSSCPVVLTEKHIIFGIFYDLKYFSAINYVVLLAKMYIYRQKMKEKILYFKYFLHELKYRLDIERTICETTNLLPIFEKKWAGILNSL
jgi:hypothetical protein